MADVNANIGVNIDTSEALAQLKALQRQISQFHTSIAKSSETAALAQRDLQRNFINSVNSLGAFSAELRTVRTTAESFTDSLEKNKFSMREYFRYAGGATRTFGRLFKSEFDTIGKVAEDRVKKLQTQYIKLGRDTSGAMKAIAIIPNELDMKSWSTQTQLAAQRQAIFNQLVKQGSTNLLNFGKNTQWAGRQLMVGFTLPLASLGVTAARTFMDMETAALKFRKVYGDLFTPSAETEAALQAVTALGQEFTKYGVAVSQTVGLAAEAAAAGFAGLDLQRQTTEATRLSILGQIDQQKALETTIALQNAFKMSSEDLASSIDFLNAVENQTVVSLDDITTAIPKVAPVIQQLGGDVKDLTFFLAAMKEGGINASEGANALKSGLGALINPTEKASQMLAAMGINIKSIIETNQGDLKGTVVAFAEALDALDPLNRARAIEQLFGKFQFARLSTLFDNVINQTGQASRVLDLAGLSIEELGSLSDKELGMTADSAMNQFRKSVEDLKLALVPVGKTFLQAVTPIVEFVGGILEKFNNLSDGVKKAIVIVTVAIGAIGPVALMTFGLLANGLANIVKGALILRQGYLRLTGQTQILGEQTDYLTTEQINATAVAHSLDQSHARLTQTFTAESSALQQLIQAYESAARAGANFAMQNPGMMVPPRRRFNKGVMVVPGSGNRDTVPAMLTPGEAVIPKDKAKKYAPLIEGMIAGNIPGYMAGTVSVGGRATGLDFARSDTAAKAQRLIDAMLADGAGIENAMTIVEETLSRMANDTKISIDSFVRELDLVTKSLTGKQVPGAVFKAAGRGERRFSAGQTGIGTMEQQVAGNAVLQEELSRARGSASAAQQAMVEYYQSIGKDAGEFSNVVQQAGDVHRAHVIDIRDNVDKMFMEAWDPRAWVAQSSTLNQVSNILQSSKSTRDEYFKNLSEINADETVVASIMEKITNNIALTEQELGVQKQVLERMLSSTASMAKVAPNFGPQAAGAVAATQFLMQNPATQAGVGARSAQQTAAAQQALAQAKFRGQQSFVPVTQAAQALTNQVVLETARAAGTQSPSKKTIPIGEDIARGLSVGMMNQADDVAQTAAGISQGAVSQMRPSGLVDKNGNPLMIPVSQPSVSLGQAQEGAAMGQETRRSMDENRRKLDASNAALGRMNGKLMGATFAIGSITGALSMFGADLGGLSPLLFKINAGMFALATTLQVLTNTKFLTLLIGGFGRFSKMLGKTKLGQKAAGTTVAQGVGRAGAGIAARAGIGAAVTGIGVGTGGVGFIVMAALAALAAMIYGVNKAYKKHMYEIERFGKAAHISANELENLSSGLGANLAKSAFEAPTMFGKTAEAQQSGAKYEQAIKETKELMDRVDTLRAATAGQATAILASFGIELVARGMSPQEVQLLLETMAKMSGKSKVLINSQIRLDTVNLEEQLKNSTEIFDLSFKPAIDEVNNSTKDLQKNLNLVAGVTASAFTAISTQLSRGTLSIQQSNRAFAAIRQNVKSLGKTRELIVLKEALISLNPQVSEAQRYIKNTADAFMLMKVGAAGVDLSGFIKQIREAKGVTDELRSSLDTVFQGALNVLALQRQVDEARAKLAEMQANQIRKTGGGTALTEEEKLNAQLEALKKLQAKLKIQSIIEIAKPAQADFKKNVGKIISDINAELAKVEVDIRIDPKSVKTIFDIERELKGLDLDSALAITPNYRAAQFQVEDLNTSIEQYNRENDLASRKINILEESLQKQADALQEVSDIQAYLTAQQKRQITLADALSQGDISAAAQAAEEMRGEAAQFRLEQEKKSLENNPELLLLREQIAKNDEIIYDINEKIYSIQQESIKPVEDRLKAIERERTLLNDMKSDYDALVAFETESLRIKKMSAQEIEQEIDLLQAQLELLGGTAGDAISETGQYTQEQIDEQKKRLAALEAALAKAQQDLTKEIPEEAGPMGWWKKQWERFKIFITEDVPNFFKKLPDMIATAAGNIWRGLKTFKEWLDEQKDNIRDWFGSLPGLIGGWLIAIWNGIPTFISWLDSKKEDIKTWFTNLPTNIKTWAGDLWRNLQKFSAWVDESTQPVQTWFTNLPTNVKTWAGDLWKNLKKFSSWLDESTQPAQTWLTNLPTNIKTWAGDLWKNLKTFATWVDESTTPVQTWLTNLPTNIKTWSGELWRNLKTFATWVDESTTPFQTWLTNLPTNIQTWSGILWRNLKTFAAWVDESTTPLQTWLTNLPTNIKTWAGNIWRDLKTFGTWLEDKWEAAKTWLSELPEKVKTAAGNIWGKLPTIKTFLSNVWNDFKEWLESLPGKIAGAVSKIDLFGSIRGQLNSVLGSIASGIASTISGAIEAGKSAVEKAKEAITGKDDKKDDKKTVPAPKDTDKDGIPDSIDKTPKGDTKGTLTPGSKGDITGGGTVGGPKPGGSTTGKGTTIIIGGGAAITIPGLGDIGGIGGPDKKGSSSGGGGSGGLIQFKSRGGLMKPKYMAFGGLARGTDKIPAMLSPGEFIMSKYAVQNYGVDKLKAMNSGNGDTDNVYNYSINVNVKSGANADDIARNVMTQIRQIDSQRIRGQRA